MSSKSIATQLPVEGYARLHLILSSYPVGRSSWYAGVKTGKYPKPVKIGARMVAWRVEDIRALIKNADSSSNDATA